MRKVNTKFLVTLFILFFSIFYAIPALFPNYKAILKFYDAKSIRLGLDLQGGSQLLLKVETKAALNEKLQNFQEDIRIKLEEEKFSFDNISLVSEKIMVSFPDEKSLENGFKIEKEFPSLELRKENLFIEFSLKDDYLKEFYSSLMLQSLADKGFVIK